jgi:hypothetical protein
VFNKCITDALLAAQGARFERGVIELVSLLRAQYAPEKMTAEILEEAESLERRRGSGGGFIRIMKKISMFRKCSDALSLKSNSRPD